mgnify:CR=1 FL=1
MNNPDEFEDSNPYFEGLPFIIFRDNSTMLLQNNYEWIPQASDIIHEVQLGDTCESLAWRYYTKHKGERAPQYYHLIANANKDKIVNTFSLDHLVGQEIIIPDVKLYIKVRNDSIES